MVHSWFTWPFIIKEIVVSNMGVIANLEKKIISNESSASLKNVFVLVFKNEKKTNQNECVKKGKLKGNWRTGNEPPLPRKNTKANAKRERVQINEKKKKQS